MLTIRPIEFLAVVIIVATLVAFFYILLSKWGVWEYLQVHADGWVSKIFPRYNGEILNQLFSCSFCTTWWVTFIPCLILALILKDASVLLIPLCSTPISRFLV